MYLRNKYKIKKSSRGIEATSKFCNSVDVINFKEISKNIIDIKKKFWLVYLLISLVWANMVF